MKITKDNLKTIIREELADILEEQPSRGTPEDLLQDLRNALNALGKDSLTPSNLETIQGLLDGLKAAVSQPAEMSPGLSRLQHADDRWSAIERGVAPE